MPNPSPTGTEDTLLTNVLDLCALLHLRTAHFRPARTANGWRTAVAGDGKGFPDLVIAGPAGVLFRELKGPRGTCSPEQKAWLTALAAAGADADVWDPSDWRSDRIRTELIALARRAAAPGVKHDAAQPGHHRRTGETP